MPEETPKNTAKTTKGWPPERRKAQAERIRNQQPWTRSTGPRSDSGKARAALNATTHGMTGTAARELRDALRAQRLAFSPSPIPEGGRPGWGVAPEVHYPLTSMQEDTALRASPHLTSPLKEGGGTKT